MTDNSALLKRQHRLEDHLQTHSSLLAGFVLLLAFLLRLWRASGTFLNPDEAMHFLAANRTSLAEAYQASLNLAHPPLLILLLNLWRRLGTSELFLRLPSVVAGTILCWIVFRWLTRLLGPTVGWVGFMLVSLLPVFIELSAEIRQYPLLLCFMMAAAYQLELALDQNSPGKMAAFFCFLYLAMLSHFSAFLFAGAIALYSLWRLLSARPSRSLVTTWIMIAWIMGQAGALGLFLWLYQVQISKLKAGASAQNMHLLLANSYFHWGQENLLRFVFARTFGVLQYAFSQLVIGDLAGILFLAGIVLLLSGKSQPKKETATPSHRQLGLLLLLPFVSNGAAAILDLYPYGGTRHSAFLLPFAIASVSVVVANVSRHRFAFALGGALVVVVACHLFGAPHRPYMRSEDQHRSNMLQAMNAIQQNVSSEDIVFVDFQSSFLLRFYRCPEVRPDRPPLSAFATFSCGGNRVISLGPETNVLTADSFPQRWNEMVEAYNLPPGQAVWIFQAGWDIDLAQELPEKVREFRDLRAQSLSISWGRNISLFKLTVRQPSLTVERTRESDRARVAIPAYQIVLKRGDLRIRSSRVTNARPVARAVAPIRRSAGSRG